MMKYYGEMARRERTAGRENALRPESEGLFTVGEGESLFLVRGLKALVGSKAIYPRNHRFKRTRWTGVNLSRRAISILEGTL